MLSYHSENGMTEIDEVNDLDLKLLMMDNKFFLPPPPFLLLFLEPLQLLIYSKTD